MAADPTLLLKAKARRRRAEAEGAATAMPAADHPIDAGAIASDLAPNMANAASAAPPPSLVDQIMGTLGSTGNIIKQGGLGVSRGISNMAGLPGDIASLLPDFLPGGGQLKNVLPTSPEVQHLFHLDQAQPQGFGETMSSRVGEEVGSALIPEVGVLMKALKMGLPAVRAAGPLTRYFLEQAALDPAKHIGNEVTAAVAAGTGAGAVDSIPGVDRSTPVGQAADLIGAIMGNGVASVGSHVLKSTGTIFDALRQNPNFTDEMTRSAVTDRVAKAAGLPGTETAKGVYDTQPLVDQIMAGRSGSPSEVIPGFQESLADRTGNPGVASLEYSRQSGPNAGAFTQRRSANTDAVDQAMQAVAPTETPGAFRSALDTERDTRLNAAAADTQGAQSDFDRYIQTLVPQMDAEGRGAAVRGGVANAERASDETQRALWAGVHGEVDPAPLAERMDATRETLPLARQDAIADVNNTVNIPRRLSTPAGDVPAGPVDVQELNAMRTTLTDQQRAARSAGDRNRVEALGRFIDEVNGYLGSDAVPADIRAQTDEARRFSRHHNETFNRPNDPLAATLAAKEGRPNIPDSAVAKQFVQPDSGQASNIDRLLAQTDLSSHAVPVRDALKDEIVAGIDKGKMAGDPARLDEYLNQFGRVFDRFPELRTEIRNAADAGRRLDTASEAQSTLQADVGTPDGTVKGRGTVGKYLQHGDADSERAINEVLASKDPAKAADDLMGFIGNNPRGVEGARAAFWQKLRTESQSVDNSQRSMGGGRAWRGDWLKSFLDKPATRAVAERLYADNPDALAQLDLYAGVLDNVDLRQRGKATGTSGTAQGVNPILTPETLQSRAYAYLSGRVSGTYLVTSIAAVIARRAVRKAQTEAIERLTDKVLLNPDLAAEMLKENNPANRAALNRRAKAWLGNEAATLMDLLNGDEQENKKTEEPEKMTGDPVVDAAMRGK